MGNIDLNPVQVLVLKHRVLGVEPCVCCLSSAPLGLREEGREVGTPPSLTRTCVPACEWFLCSVPPQRVILCREIPYLFNQR